MTVRLGLEQELPSHWRNERLGVVMHPASVNSSYRLIHDVLLDRGYQVGALFGPQHGIYGQTQDNMIEWEGFKDPDTGIPIYSLYGKHRTPTSEMLRDLDRLVIDLQDVGARYYTFIWTMLNCMRAAFEHGIPVSVLDRPNPIDAITVEGPILDMNYQSFVGLAPIPVRHGLTIAELARWFMREFKLQGELETVAMTGYLRESTIRDLDLPWVFPSPNMPTPETADVYPGGCLLEATNISEARGTTLPFELVGAPYIDANTLLDELAKHDLPGVAFRRVHFQPTFHKWAEQLCNGVHLHVTSRRDFKPFRTYCVLIAMIKKIAPDQFEWLQPPYEYNEHQMPIDILSGDDRFRRLVDTGSDLQPWLEESDRAAQSFKRSNGDILLYDI